MTKGFDLMKSRSKYYGIYIYGVFTDDSGLQVHKDSSGDVLSSSSLTEEGVEGVVSSSDGFVAGHLSIRLDAMFQAVKLPASIADLDTGLTNVDGDTLTLWGGKKQERLYTCVR